MRFPVEIDVMPSMGNHLFPLARAMTEAAEFLTEMLKFVLYMPKNSQML